MARALIPSELVAGLQDRLPDGVGLETYDGLGPPPDLGHVEFYVPPYMAGDEVYRLIPRMPALRVVQTLTAGVELVLPFLPDGVTLCNAKGVHDASTAELAITLTLASLGGLPAFIHAQDAHDWRPVQRGALADRTVLIVGYGAIGAAIDRRLEGFEADVRRVARRARDGVSGMDELPALLPSADVVIIIVPLTDGTRGLVDADFLTRMKPGSLLVNVSRGPVVDTAALLAELTSGRLRAALDVTDPEPLPPDHPLWRAPGLLLTPHVGGNTTALLPRAVRLVGAQLHRYAAGEPLVNIIE
jgi:phosphoglycerate dehydrogenase-like enzyme